MGKRSTGRRLTIQILYQMELSNASFEQACEAAFTNTDYIEATRDFAAQYAEQVWALKAEIDPVIDKYSKGWKIERINVIDKSILRLAVYEMLHVNELPKSVIIDEAVELAKKFSDPDAAKFINGILGNIE
ncbi:MAG: transcription antitermination factor NusB [Candidatus Margulisiibacteriota bacterium]